MSQFFFGAWAVLCVPTIAEAGGNVCATSVEEVPLGSALLQVAPTHRQKDTRRVTVASTVESLPAYRALIQTQPVSLGPMEEAAAASAAAGSGTFTAAVMPGLMPQEEEEKAPLAVTESWASPYSSTQVSSGRVLRTWEEAFEENPQLFDGCAHVFIDVGSNRGTHIRKLFEPEKYPDASYLALFDEGFGSPRSAPSSASGICAFGFEANPRWTSTLKNIQTSYLAKGWRVEWFVPAAVSNTTGNVSLWLNDGGNASDWGASVKGHTPEAKPVMVPAVDLAYFMQVLNKHAAPGYRLMKMDIEGTEYMILPQFLEKKILCKRWLDKLTIEWHPRLLEQGEAEVGSILREQVNSSAKCGGLPATKVETLDDESYRDDGMALP